MNIQPILKENHSEIYKEMMYVYKTSPKIDVTRGKEYSPNLLSNPDGWDGDENWLNYGLKYNIWINENKCPFTVKLLKSLEKEGVYIDFTGFSLLRGKTEIEPHTDTKKPNFYPKSIHYGLSVPENCYIIIDGNYFDDSLLHSAYNDSKENRFILYIKLV